MDINKIILKAFDKTASLEEYQTLEAWKQESNENIEYLKSMQENYSSMNYQEFDKESAWNNINSKLEVKQPKKVLWSWLVAAAIVLSLVIGAFVFMNGEKPIDLFKTKNNVEYFALKDNSEIWLNKDSEVQYLSDFTSERKVSLSGEAYFQVQADKSNPFIIAINENDFIKVVGTSFNVINRGSAFDLAVYSGHVELHTLDRVIHLQKNDRIVKVNGAFAKITNTSKNLLSWKNKELIFDNVNLSKVFVDLGKYYEVEFVIDEKVNLHKCKLRSKYNQESISDVMKELDSIFDLEYTITDATISINKLNCN